MYTCTRYKSYPKYKSYYTIKFRKKIKKRYDDLNDNGFHMLLSFNAWSPITRIIWEGLGVVLMEEVCH